MRLFDALKRARGGRESGAIDVSKLGVIDPSWVEKDESRQWRLYPELAKIPERYIASAGRKDAALEYAALLKDIDSAMARFEDLDFVYSWKITVLFELKDVVSAKLTLLNGLQKARKKAFLCTGFATALYQSETGRCAPIIGPIHWWLVSAVIQTNARKWTNEDPFQHLSAVAEAIPDSAAAAKLDQMAGRIRADTSLYPETIADIRSRVRQLPSNDVRFVHSALGNLIRSLG